MIDKSHACDPRRLRDLLAGGLPEEQSVRVTRHLDGCTVCQEQLERIAADASWWDEAQSYLSESGEVRLFDQPAISEADSGPGHSSVGESSLDFLAASDDPLSIGRLGKYEVVEVVGRGGMGVVLKTFDAELNRYVAVKVLAPQFTGSAAAKKRFAREAQAAAAIVHPHVVPIYAVDVSGDSPYLVMPYIVGESLEQRLTREGPLDLREIVRIASQTALGLQAAHKQGLVHRDIKPANILLEHSVGRVFISDFGLARAVDDATLTHSGVITGTPHFMSPEQARGDVVDHRSDLFSFGCVLYTMCTGEVPFDAASTLAVLRRVCDGRPRPVRDRNPDIPVWLVRIIDRLLAKNPDDRFDSAEEVGKLLEGCAAHLQQPDHIPLPSELRPQRHWALWAVGVLVVLGVLGVASGFDRSKSNGHTSSNVDGAQAQQKLADDDTSPIESSLPRIQGFVDDWFEYTDRELHSIEQSLNEWDDERLLHNR